MKYAAHYSVECPYCRAPVGRACQRLTGKGHVTVVCSEGEGIQACRHAANVAADRVILALSSGKQTDG